MPQSQTTGAMVYLNGSGNWVGLPAGTNGQLLNISAGIPSWTSSPTFSGATFTGPILNASGTNLAPSVSFSADNTSGMYWAAGGHVNISAGGTKVIDATSSAITITPNTTITGTLSASSLTLGSPLGIGQGGTGQTTSPAAITALMPTSLNGGMTYFNGTNWVALGIGASDQMLKVSGGIPAWSSTGSFTTLNLASGTAPLPSLTFGTDLTTGLWSSASGSLNIAASGSNAVSVTSSLVTIVPNTSITGTLSAASLTLTSALAIAQGGTGATTQQGALNNIMPSSPTTGETVYYSGTNWTGLAAGATGAILNIASGIPAWTLTPSLTSLTLSTPLGLASGGTNAATAPAAIKNLMPTSAAGGTTYYDGTNWVALAAGAAGRALVMSSGAPAWNGLGTLQIQRATNSTASTLALTTTPVTVTGLSVAITLATATNRVRVDMSFTGSVSTNNAYLYLYRGATQIAKISGFYSASQNQVNPCSYSYIDTPGSVGPFTYTIQAATAAATGTLNINRDAASALTGFTSTFYLTEIGG